MFDINSLDSVLNDWSLCPTSAVSRIYDAVLGDLNLQSLSSKGTTYGIICVCKTFKIASNSWHMFATYFTTNLHELRIRQTHVTETGK